MFNGGPDWAYGLDRDEQIHRQPELRSAGLVARDAEGSPLPLRSERPERQGADHLPLQSQNLAVWSAPINVTS